MILVITIIAFILFFVFLVIGAETYKDIWANLAVISGLIGIIFTIFGFINGFINYPPTEGTHQGVITAVDLEGIYFRRYEVYLKSSGYTTQSDETSYLIYDYETELAEKLKNCIGKEVKLIYGHDGGYIPWNSCGTYHIKMVELVEK